MSRQDVIASKAIRKSTLKSLKEKKRSRIKQLKQQYEEQYREIEIQYAEDPERLKAKYAAEDYAKSEKARKRADAKIAKAKKVFEEEKLIRKLTLSEEIGSAVVQGIGCALFIAATAILDAIALNFATNYISTTAVFYSLAGASMVLMYLFSLLNHALTNSGAKLVFNRLSHIFSYLIIGFCYTVYTITKIQGTKGWVIFGIVWVFVLLGIIFYAIGGKRFETLSIIFYAIAGFSGLFVAKTLLQVVSVKSFGMLVLAAVFYIIGLVFYNLRNVKYMHLISNCVMLMGSIYMFFSLFFMNA